MQAALNGGDAKDIAKGIGIGMLTGRLGGDRYKPTLHFWNRLYVTDGIKAIKGGVIYGAKISGIDMLLGFAREKIKKEYNEIRENNMEVSDAK